MTVKSVFIDKTPTISTQFVHVKQAKEQVVWDKLADITVYEMVQDWLATLSFHTGKSYRSAINILSNHGLINLWVSMQAFTLVNHESIIDRIKQLDFSEASKQARAAAYISFTKYLSRRFKGIFNKAIPSLEGNSKTFFKIRDKVSTNAVNHAQWIRFFEQLEKINHRDALIGKVMLQGGKRVEEVLTVEIDQINWDEREICFNQSKTMGQIKQTVITYSEEIMNRIKRLIGDRTDGLVFLSGNGTKINRNQLHNTFAKAGILAGIPFKMTPRVLRTSAVTYLKSQGFSDSEIMKITGHSSASMVHAYDKTDIADNPSKIVNLVG